MCIDACTCTHMHYCTKIYAPLYNYIGLVVRVFSNSPGDRGSIPGLRLKKWY